MGKSQFLFRRPFAFTHTTEAPKVELGKTGEKRVVHLTGGRKGQGGGDRRGGDKGILLFLPWVLSLEYPSLG